MKKERLLVTVKTYPTLSRKYGETVCTAAVREDGSWVRLYPVPFRRLDEEERYRKFDWIECGLVKRREDPRPESYRPAGEIVRVGHMGTSGRWRARRELLLGVTRVYDRLSDVIEGAKENEVSLAVFKPKRVVKFGWEQDEREWSRERLAEMRGLYGQLDLFGDNDWRRTFRLVDKLPYSFSYRFEDTVGQQSELTILDWEIGMLYWNCLASAVGDEQAALEKVRAKYIGEFSRADLHFFLGTTQRFHRVAPNPWVIVGVFPIPPESQTSLF